MLHDIAIRRVKQTEAAATVLVESCGAEPPAGVVRGPFCVHARTLPAEFALQALPAADGRPSAAVATVVDPCYWTPELPFHYHLQRPGDDGPAPFALRRWYAVGASFQLAGRRAVLRGAALGVDAQTLDAASVVAAARASAAALLLPQPSIALCTAADRQGAAVIADVRDSGELSAALINGWGASGAILAVVVDAEQLADAGDALAAAGVPTALAISASTPRPDEPTLVRPTAFAAELAPGEAPPRWLADVAKPVFAIRRDETPRDIATARAAADALQAELAPQFDLAGYFVTAASVGE